MKVSNQPASDSLSGVVPDRPLVSRLSQSTQSVIIVTLGVVGLALLAQILG
jgi:hypothetical protein